MRYQQNQNKQSIKSLKSLENVFHAISVQRQTIPQLLMSQKQSDLIKHISDICKKNNNVSTQLTDMSINLSQSSRVFNCSISGVNSNCNQNRQTFEDELEQALSQVRSQCSKRVYKTIKSFINKKYQKENIDFQKMIQKYNQRSKESAFIVKKLTQENCQLKGKIKYLSDQIKSYEQQKKRKNKIINGNMEKQKRIINFEIGLLSKQKMHAQMKKNLNRQQKYLKQQQENNLRFKQYLEKTINEIINMKNVKKCEGNCWRADIIHQCMKNLNKQREILQIQSQKTQQHYLKIRQIVEKLKLSIN